MYSSHLHESDFALTTGKHTQMTKENSKEMKDLNASNVSHVLWKPLRCIHITTPYAGHVVEVTFRNHYNANDMFSNRTRLSSSLFNGGKIMLYSDSFYYFKVFNVFYHTENHRLISCRIFGCPLS